jgi:hypothetical protein
MEDSQITHALDRRALLKKGLLAGVGVAAVAAGAVTAPRIARAATLTVQVDGVTFYAQNGWDHCILCQGLYFGNGQNFAGVCPATSGGNHDPGTSYNYDMPHF